MERGATDAGVPDGVPLWTRPAGSGAVDGERATGAPGRARAGGLVPRQHLADGLEDELLGHLGDLRPELAVGVPRAPAGGGADQDAAEQREQDAEPDSADEHEQRERVPLDVGGLGQVDGEVPHREQRPEPPTPPSATSRNSHWRTRTNPAHTGIRDAPRSVSPSARSSRSLRSSWREREARARPATTDARGPWRRRRRPPAPPCRPGRAAPGRGGHGGPRASGELPARRPEVEVQPLERIRAEPGEPRRSPASRSPGRRASGWTPRRRRRLRYAGRVGERVLERGHPFLRELRRRRRPVISLQPLRGRRARRPPAGRGRPSWPRHVRRSRPQRVDPLTGAWRWWGGPARRRDRRPRAAGGRRRASSRAGGGTVSMWFSTTSITSRWVASGAR